MLGSWSSFITSRHRVALVGPEGEAPLLNSSVAIAFYAAVFAAVMWYLFPFALRKWAELRLANLCKTRRAIVLTFDDGPGETLTPRLLDTLRTREIKATFYLLGRNVVKYPSVVQRVVAEGHEIGSHTFHHSNAWKTSPWRAAQDLEAGISAVRTAGVGTREFRPPFGKLTVMGLIHGAVKKLHFGWWTIDSRDSWAPRQIDDVIAEIGARGGGVVLMHDFDSYEKAPIPSHADHVLELTRRIIEFAEAQGFKIVPMHALIKLPVA